MTPASCGSCDRALGQILARVSLNFPFCEMDRNWWCLLSNTMLNSPTSHFVRTAALSPATESTPNTSNPWKVHITGPRCTHTITVTQRYS